MKLFAIIYLHGHLAAAMFLWPGATLSDCQKINSEYAHNLDQDWAQGLRWANPKKPTMIDGHRMLRTDIRLACEWHKDNPVRDATKH